MATIFNSVATVLAAVGQDLGVTDYITIDQKRIDTFADATGDHQWIHVDPVKAKDGPFGATVAHGYLTLSLANLFLPQLVNYENLSMGVNYGTDKVRFPAPALRLLPDLLIQNLLQIRCSNQEALLHKR